MTGPSGNITFPGNIGLLNLKFSALADHVETLKEAPAAAHKLYTRGILLEYQSFKSWNVSKYFLEESEDAQKHENTQRLEDKNHKHLKEQQPLGSMTKKPSYVIFIHWAMNGKNYLSAKNTTSVNCV